MPSVEGCPADFTFRTSIVNKREPAPKGHVWLKLRIDRSTPKLPKLFEEVCVPIPAGLTKEQQEYMAKCVRIAVKANAEYLLERKKLIEEREKHEANSSGSENTTSGSI